MDRDQISSNLDDFSKFLDYFIPGEQICMDELTMKFKGRISFITYNLKKPTKWDDIRVYTLVDSNTGYVCCILPYGSLTTELLVRPDLPVFRRIPIHLYEMLLNKIPGARGHHMFTDCYISYILAQELAKLKCHFTGTNRKGLPSKIKKLKFLKKSTVVYGRGTLLLAWKDKRTVTCLTIKNDYRRKDCTRWCGNQHQETQYIQLRRTYLQHRDLASTLIIDEPRLNGKLHIVLKGIKRDCKACSDHSKPGGRRETSYYCDTCPD
ncbi:unnamed protein product, partial [Heterotrigona itama]